MPFAEGRPLSTTTAFSFRISLSTHLAAAVARSSRNRPRFTLLLRRRPSSGLLSGNSRPRRTVSPSPRLLSAGD